MKQVGVTPLAFMTIFCPESMGCTHGWYRATPLAFTGSGISASMGCTHGWYGATPLAFRLFNPIFSNRQRREPVSTQPPQRQRRDPIPTRGETLGKGPHQNKNAEGVSPYPRNPNP
jgi:hypothetical protein